MIENNFEECAKVIRESFITVTEQFKITKQNAPTNPAFIEAGPLRKLQEFGIAMFGAYLDGNLIGFVAIEEAGEAIYYLEKLSVLPEFRHQGYGTQLIEFVSEFVKKMGGKKISIGIINNHSILKNWYIKNGFVETGLKTFKQLPFDVCFMEKAV